MYYLNIPHFPERNVFSCCSPVLFIESAVISLSILFLFDLFMILFQEFLRYIEKKRTYAQRQWEDYAHLINSPPLIFVVKGLIMEVESLFANDV